MKNEIEFSQLQEILKSLKTEASPSIEFRENARIRILNQISETPKEKAYSANRFFSFRIALALVLTLLVLSSGTILAAQNVGPKSQLYPVKIASENIALGLSPAPIKQKLAVEIVKRRAQELSDSQKSEDSQQIQESITRYKDSLNQAKTIVPSSDTNLSGEITKEEKFLNSVEGYHDETPVQNGNDKSKGTEDENKTEIKSNVNIDLLSPTPVRSNEESVKSDSTVQSENKGKGSQEKPSQTFDPVESVQRGVENAIHDLTATPSPQDN